MTKILIVEDEESVLDPLELLLTKEGFLNRDCSRWQRGVRTICQN
jgi:DNA-binding response OmpR family regulator